MPSNFVERLVNPNKLKNYRLNYFVGRGRAELSRLIFHLAGVKFIDNRIEMHEWPSIQPKLPNSCLPALEVNGQFLCESMAIARYLANQFHVAGKTDWEKGLCDMYVDMVQDMFDAYEPVMKAALSEDLDKMAEQWTLFEKKKLMSYMAKFEKVLGGSKSGWLVGEKCTWADLHLAQMVELFQTVYDLELKAFPLVKTHCYKVYELPGIRKYLSTRPETTW